LELEVGGHSAAEAEFRRALALDPEHGPTLASLASLLAQDQAALGEAVVLSRRALALDPRHLPALTNLASLLARNWSTCSESGALFRRALEFDPQCVPALTGLAALLVRGAVTRDRKCDGWFERMFPGAVCTPWEEHQNKSAFAYLDVDAPQWAETVELCRRTLAVDPHHATTMINLALLRAQETRASVALLRRALAVDPENVEALCYLAAHLRAFVPGARDEAEALLRRALEHDPEHIDSLRRLASLLAKEAPTRAESKQLMNRVRLLMGREKLTLMTGPFRSQRFRRLIGFGGIALGLIIAVTVDTTSPKICSPVSNCGQWNVTGIISCGKNITTLNVRPECNLPNLKPGPSEQAICNACVRQSPYVPVVALCVLGFFVVLGMCTRLAKRCWCPSLIVD
jgi:tetratricopeptide (TPR) repeat protein